jgi:hypothetical protein
VIEKLNVLTNGFATLKVKFCTRRAQEDEIVRRSEVLKCQRFTYECVEGFKSAAF